jgi:hypothetical protein
MNPTIEKLLLVRDRDLVRWGRLSAVICLLGAVVSFAGAFACHYMVTNKLVPSMERSADLEAKILRKIGPAHAPESVRDGFAADSRLSREMIEALTSLSVTILLASGIMALACALGSWRSYELAKALQQAGLDAAGHLSESVLGIPPVTKEVHRSSRPTLDS